MDPVEYAIYFIYTFVSFFIIVNPVEATMVFVSLTAGASPAERARISLRTTAVAYSIALIFAIGGDLILRFFGITVDSLRVAGGVLLFLVAMDMLRAKPNKKITTAEILDAGGRDDVSVFPLATPLLTGPGAITTVIVLMGAAPGITHKLIVLLALTATFAVTYPILLSSELIDRIMGLTGILVLTRILGLILGAIAVDFAATGAWNIYRAMAFGAGI